MEHHVCAAFSDPGNRHDHCPLSHKREESTLWVEKRGDWGWIDNRIKDYQVWALRGERWKLSPPNGGATTLKPFPIQLWCGLSHDLPRTSQLPGGWMFTRDMPGRYQPPQGPIIDPAYWSGTRPTIMLVLGIRNAQSGSNQVSEAIFMQVLTTFSKERNMVA